MPTPIRDPKRCTGCGDHKPRSLFSALGNGRAVRSKCRECEAKATQTAYSKNPAACNLASNKWKLKAHYGMTFEDYDAMLAAQGGRCAICRSDKPYGRGRFSIDHCHAEGHVRGLLCNHCNTGLGLFKDDPALMLSAIQYLQGAKNGKCS